MNTSPLDLPHSKPNEHTHSIKTNLKFYIEEKPQNKLKSPNEKPHAKLKSPNEENSQIFSFKMDLKQKESTLQKNLQTCESPILKIAKKQKSKQLAEMMTEVQSDVKALSYNSINSIENELISPDSSPKKNYIRTPQPTKSTHKISKSTFLQHKYLENLVSKTNDLTKIDKEKNFKINLTNVPNNIINEVDPSHEETPNNINFKFKFMCHNEETSPSEINRNKYMKMNKKESEVYEHPFRHLIFSPKISENLFKKHLLITYKGITYSQRLQNPSESFLKSRAINLPENKDRAKTLFMDLDETLIHSCHVRENPEIVLDILGKKIAFNIRPYCKEFLEKISKYYEVFLFTASTEAYAKAIINHIDTNKIIRGLFTDKVTMNTKNGFIIKDLRIFENRDLKNMIIVDNLAHCFSYQIDNGVPLLEWQSDVDDKELKYLYEYLKKAVSCDDVREYNAKNLKLRELGQLNLDDLKL